MAKRSRSISVQVEQNPTSQIIRLKNQIVNVEEVDSVNHIELEASAIMVEYTGTPIPFNLTRTRTLVAMIEYTGTPVYPSLTKFGPKWQIAG